MVIRIPEPRALCLRCRRGGGTCFCASIRRFDPGFSLVLLAHPREARNPVGTLRMTHLCVEGSLLVIGTGAELDQDRRLAKLLEDPSVFPAVLFPGSGSVSLDDASAIRAGLPAGRRLALLVIDGTWSQAITMIRSSRKLSTLPRLSFAPERPSEYEFRRQPQPHCLSTLEAVHAVIDRLDRACVYPAPAGRAHDGMLEVFRGLVRFQLEQEELNARQRTELNSEKSP